jgi:hypothetical protein
VECITFADEELRNKLAQKYKTDTSGLKFHSFADLEENVKNHVDRIKSTPFLPKNTAVYGVHIRR